MSDHEKRRAAAEEAGAEIRQFLRRHLPGNEVIVIGARLLILVEALVAEIVGSSEGCQGCQDKRTEGAIHILRELMREQMGAATGHAH